MIPGTYNLTLVKNVTWDGLRVLCQDSDGAAVDLTGWSAAAQVRKKRDAGTVILDLQPVITDAEAGEVTLPEIPAGSSAGYACGGYVWDLVMTDADGKKRGPILSGTFVITTSITR
jgi:hypothetical protein